MEIKASARDISRARVDALIVSCFAGAKKPGGSAALIDRALDGVLGKLIAAGEIKGKRGELTIIHTLGKMAPARIAVLGLGPVKGLGTDGIRAAMAEAARALRAIGVRRIGTVLHGAETGGPATGKITAAESAQAIAEGAILGLYQFSKHTRDGTDGAARVSKRGQADSAADRAARVSKRAQSTNTVSELLLLDGRRSRLPEMQAGLEAGRAIAESVCLARDMINEPANCMTPSDMARVAVEMGRETGVEVEVLDREDMAGLGMGAMLGVARGSAEPPRFIIMRYRGDPRRAGRVMGLVGKGVTFDSGGISLKPAAGMADMKTDMSGGAAVIAAMRAIALLKPPVNVTGLVPAAENMPSNNALKPGDIVTAMNGKTIEVENTDAEGRLLLAEALSYGRKHGLSPLVDVATLTGAMRTTFGDVCSGAFTNHQATVNRVLEAAAQTGEKVWQMPLYEEYKDQVRSEVADVKNTGGRLAGSITAACFLAEFAQDTPWVHLDIAGTARRESTRGYVTRGASGVMVRTLVQLVRAST